MRFEKTADVAELGAPLEDVAQEAIDATASVYTGDGSIDVEEQLRVQLEARGIAAADDRTIQEAARGIRSGHRVAVGRSDWSVDRERP